MASSTLKIPLIILAIFLRGTALAQKPSAPPLKFDEIKNLLNLKTKLDMAHGQEMGPQNADLFERQKQALGLIGERKMSALLPSVVEFVDYPSTFLKPDEAPQGDVYVEEALRTWPAFKSLWQLKDRSAPILEAAISNPNRDFRNRLTDLQILFLLAPAKAVSAGQDLKKGALKANQPGVADRIDRILEGKLPYWGLIEFRPVTMTPAEILQQLEPNHVLPAQSSLLSLMKFPALAGTLDESTKQAIKTMNGQLEAIYNAGELKMVSAIPALIDYMPYQFGPTGFISASMVTTESRRKRHPALDALLKIGSLGETSLEIYIADNQNSTSKRLTALSTLREINYPAAVKIGTEILEEPEFKADENNIRLIKAYLKPVLSLSDFLQSKKN